MCVFMFMYHSMLNTFHFPSFFTLALSLNLWNTLLRLSIDFGMRNDLSLCLNCISTNKNSFSGFHYF